MGKVQKCVDMENIDRQRHVLDLGNGKKTAQVTRYLLDALKDNDPDIRAVAAFSIGRLRVNEAMWVLCDYVGDKNQPDHVRIRSAYALWKISDPRSVPTLIAALNDPADGVILFSTKALGEMRDIRAVGPLTELLSHESAEVREYAANALKCFQVTEQDGQ